MTPSRRVRDVIRSRMLLSFLVNTAKQRMRGLLLSTSFDVDFLLLLQLLVLNYSFHIVAATTTVTEASETTRTTKTTSTTTTTTRVHSPSNLVPPSPHHRPIVVLTAEAATGGVTVCALHSDQFLHP